MKIAVLIPSYQNSDSLFEKYSKCQDPSRYMSKHEFHLRYITKDDAHKQLDDIKQEKFDALINFLWGSQFEPVADIDIVKYAETLGVPIVGASSKFLSLSKINFKLAMSKCNILTPSYHVIRSLDDVGTCEKFPVIMKQAENCSRLHMTDYSVCHNMSEAQAEIGKLLSVAEGQILVEEYIFGREYSAMVYENISGVFAMTPIVYDFLDSVKPDQQFSHVASKFILVDSEGIKFKLVDESNPLTKKIKRVACDAYNALHIHVGGYARINIKIDDNSNIYVLEVIPTPALFSTIDNTFDDDYVISQCFEGGHQALLDLIIECRFKNIAIAHGYDSLSVQYDDFYESSGFLRILKNVCEKYDFSGTVLDLGCGTGICGKLIKNSGHSSTLIGVDLSSKMMEKATLYSKLHVCPMENFIFETINEKYDHVVAIGCLHFLNDSLFESVLHRLFEIATKSITIHIDEITDQYNQALVQLGHECYYGYNRIDVINALKCPDSWFLVYRERDFMWKSAATGDEIYGSIIRFEKISKY